MRGCRRVTHGGVQWWRSAKIIRVDLVEKQKYSLFTHANMHSTGIKQATTREPLLHALCTKHDHGI
jgi:hypothetical protein